MGNDIRLSMTSAGDYTLTRPQFDSGAQVSARFARSDQHGALTSGILDDSS
jgi:hypothetical protein